MKVLRVSVLLTLVFSLFFAGTTPKYSIGDKVADFELKNVDGKMVSLSDFKNAKGIILIFDCNTCPVSKAYNERIMALHKKYESKGFPVVAINSNSPELSPGDSFEEMVDVAKRKKYEFAYLADNKQVVARAFGASNTPHTYILKKEGEDFTVQYVGAIDNNSRDASAADKKYVEEAVDALLGGKAVATPTTKAIGCGIKYKS
jgi:peroxiredoxin